MKRGTLKEARPFLPDSGSNGSSNTSTGKARRRKKTLLTILIVLCLLVCIVSVLNKMKRDIVRKTDNKAKSSSQALNRPRNENDGNVDCNKDNIFQIWPILNVERETVLENYLTNTKQQEGKGEEGESSPPAPAVLPQAPCSRIFRPVEFFENQNSTGYEYLNHLRHLALAVREEFRLGLHHYTITKTTKDGDGDGDGDGDNNGGQEQEEFHLVYNSIPKSATSTIETAIKNLDKKIQHSDLLSGSYEFFTSEDKNKDIMQKMEREWNASSTKASSSRSSSSLSTQYKLKFRHFGLMREPVSRFVSATAQEMTVHTARQKAVVFRDLCLKDNARETLQCSIEQVRSWFATKSLHRIHFVPSALAFYTRSYGHDVPIEMFEFNDLKGVLGNFLEEDLQVNKQEDKASFKGHKEDDVVANMSVSDLSEEMIKDICALYAVDILLMRHLNMEDKYCKGHVSDKYVSTLYFGRKWENGALIAQIKEWQGQ